MQRFIMDQWNSARIRENDMRVSYQAACKAVADEMETARQANRMALRYGENHPDTKRFRDIQSHYDHVSQVARNDNIDAKNHYG
ncbi:hypothetical protein PGT21_021991 [Puccinia graminis f. sp. tritici]|uniref:Uncharacterized protein n=1 Tax=Puccinia graminis f. sp. tritici TaxID=56615 RepID=A0A5B0QJ46_PUCGR|nr:hypothetical protein PGT21_021991 [Puccinia graminis f. sp. tritici]